ncbi:MAG: CCA tRNA nucleotidyltransferase [Candidatus Micrarchaeota archaeon]|nr:CCA tRNA nucleotidyltransferase [Candidatus Micrarchaeota archaeon]
MGTMAEQRYGIEKSALPRLAKLLERVLNDVKPNPEEIKATTRSINEVVGKLKKVTPKNVEILVAGSVARGTQIRGSSDVDIFLLFPRKMDEKEIEKKGLEIAKKIIDKKAGDTYSMNYAEHPYTKIKFSKLALDVEIVPAYKIRDIKERSTAVDRTQLHNDFVISNLTSKQRDDVRILKTFLNSRHIYGAEARIEGFSGYLCELLIYHYKSFERLLAAFANLKLPLALDMTSLQPEFGKGSANVKKYSERFGKDFVVIDPVDENRNVAASVSDESLARLVLACRELIKNPNDKSFFGHGYSDIGARAKLSKLSKDLGTDMFVLHFKTDEIAEDIIWQQVKRLRLKLNDTLTHHGFCPTLSAQNMADNEAVIAFFVVKDLTIRSCITKGPSVIMGEAAERFMKSHSNSLFFALSGDSIRSTEKPKFTTAEQLLRHALTPKGVDFPSYLDKRRTKLFVNSTSEGIAKMIYQAYSINVSL